MMLSVSMRHFRIGIASLLIPCLLMEQPNAAVAAFFPRPTDFSPMAKTGFGTSAVSQPLLHFLFRRPSPFSAEVREMEEEVRESQEPLGDGVSVELAGTLRWWTNV